jgi:hypothetical protein
MKPRVRKLLEWLDRSEPLLESQVVGAGLSNALNTALLDGLADMGAHPRSRSEDGTFRRRPCGSPMPDARRLRRAENE